MNSIRFTYGINNLLLVVRDFNPPEIVWSRNDNNYSLIETHVASEFA